MVQFAEIEIARRDPGVASEVRDRILTAIEAEVGLLVLGVGAMTLEALVRDDGPDLAIEVDLVFADRRVRQRQAKKKREYELHGVICNTNLGACHSTKWALCGVRYATWVELPSDRIIEGGVEHEAIRRGPRSRWRGRGG